MYIDTHCHLNFQAFDEDRDHVIRHAIQNGVEKFIVPGTDLGSSKKAIELTLAYPDNVFAAIGIHPHHAHDPNLRIDQNLRKKLEDLIKINKNRVVAIGEIGLDFHPYQKTKYENREVTKEIIAKQIDLLNLQLSIAHDFQLPVILHCREAFPQMIQIIKQHHDKYQTISSFAKATDDKSSEAKNNSRLASPKSQYNLDEGGHVSPTSTVKTNYIKPYQLHGVWHCFTGSTQDMEVIITMGYYIGFDGNITYSSSYSTLVASTPLNRILLETDSPYLSPIPNRGKRNAPSNIPLIAQAIANYHHAPLSEVIHLSTINAQQLFGI